MPGPSPVRPIVYSGRRLLYPARCKTLEAALGAELLDRSVKPPRLNSLGSRVLEQARDLQRTEALNLLRRATPNLTAFCASGLAHALAEGTLIEPIQRSTD